MQGPRVVDSRTIDLRLKNKHDRFVSSTQNRNYFWQYWKTLHLEIYGRAEHDRHDLWLRHCTSDKVITDQSGIINHLQAGDLILADKGFLIHDILPKNVFLNLPAFLSGKTQFTKRGAIFFRKITGCRIHIERAIERLRNYKILDYANTALRPFFNKIVQVCAVLVNFQSPIISGILDEYIKSTSST